MTCVFRLATNTNAILVPTALFRTSENGRTSKCEFIKCFIALPQQKYMLARKISVRALPDEDWMALPNTDFSLDLKHSKIFLKLKFFVSASDATALCEKEICGTFDADDCITQVLTTLSRSTSLRKLLVTDVQ